ncbi:MAG TPA: TIGR03086 family metal-binding protein, partial [Acidimicrobiia bacterium]|nr:TIGR03086 family metal-binding protein [Acidimicrobiia bacterium]
ELGTLMSTPLPDDYATAFRASVDRAYAAFTAPGASEKMMKLPFGEMPGSAARDIITFDLATHVADLARATGQTIADQEMAEAALALGKQVIGPDFRQPGYFGAEQSLPADAPAADRLLAFAGRSV